MLKRIEIPVPIHIKKWVEGEYVQYINEKGVIRVDKRTMLGTMINFACRVDPFPKMYKPPVGVPTIKLAYYDESYSRYFPIDRIPDFQELLDDQFRTSLIHQVRGVHEKVNREDYSEYVRDFLHRYGIVPDEDVDFDTVRKIYRDYITKIHKRFQKNFSEKSPGFR